MQTITQTQMQTFDRCRRLYYLRYVEKLVWPNETDRSEEITRGDDFHLLVRQLILGLPREKLLIPESGRTVEKWVNLFCSVRPLGTYDRIYAEKEASFLYEDILWLGKFDALTVSGNSLRIFDWKTGSQKPDILKYSRSPQTRLYRLLAKAAAPRLFGIPAEDYPAENIEMTYWFPEHPDRTITLSWSESEYQEDLTWLRLRAAEMSPTDKEAFPQTGNQKICAHCTCYSHCFPQTDAPSWAAKPEINSDDQDEDIFQSEFLFLDGDEDQPAPFSF